jgi:DNA-binding response OmpR family regulator
MKRILFVEDDVVIARIYARKLEDAGFRVLVATDGLNAIKLIPVYQPDLLVLDIMLPKLNGVEVLKFLRQHPQHQSVQVIVLSNAFLNSLWEEITTLGVQEILLKSSVSPPQLVATVQRILKPPAVPSPASRNAPAAAAPSRKSAKQSEPVLSTAVTSRRMQKRSEPVGAAVAAEPGAPSRRPCHHESASEFRRRIRRDFLEQTPAISKALRQVCGETLDLADASTQMRRLEDLHRKVGFLTHMTSMVGWHRLAQLSCAFEAFLYELQVKPGAFNDSARHTLSSTVALLAGCLTGDNPADEQCLSPTTVLVVDDDAVSTRALVMTLDHAKVKAVSVADPFKALEQLRLNSYDVVILDINLPGMSGLSLGEQLRKLPLHSQTPVIFITSYAEFEPQARSILNAGDDLIGKPIMPMELTVKVIAHMLEHRLAIEASPR